MSAKAHKGGSHHEMAAEHHETAAHHHAIMRRRAITPTWPMRMDYTRPITSTRPRNTTPSTTSKVPSSALALRPSEYRPLVAQ
jgi:hypothetical protein